MKKLLLALILGFLFHTAVHAQQTVVIERPGILTDLATALIGVPANAVTGLIAGTVEATHSKFFRLVPLQARRSFRGRFCLAGRGLRLVCRNFGIRSLIAFPDELARCSNLRTEFRRIQNLDFAAFAEDPADDLVFNCRFEYDDEGSVRQRFDLELLHELMFAQVERDGRVATQTDAADPGVHEEAVFVGLLDELLVGNEGVARESDIGNALDSVDLDVLCAVFIALRIPNTVAKREDVRLEAADRFRFIRLVIRQLQNLVHAPGIENFSEHIGLDSGLDAGGAEDGFDHGVVEEPGAVSGQRILHGRIRFAFDWFRQKIGSELRSEHGHAQNVVIHEGNIQLPTRIEQEIAAVGGIVLNGSVIFVFQRLDVPHDCPRAACAGNAFLLIGPLEKPCETSGVRVIVLPHLRHELHQAERLPALNAHCSLRMVVDDSR